MSLARFAKRRDAAERDIVNALERVGCLVYRLDVPADLLVWWRERWYLLEVKTRKRNDQPAQDEFRALTNTPVVATVEQALQAIGAMR
jgi:Holliday junction resolvase